MVRNHASNDIDFVPPDKLNVPRNRKAKQPPPDPKLLPSFNPLPIYNKHTYKALKFLPYVDLSNPF